jgi:hypothetical protein
MSAIMMAAFCSGKDGPPSIAALTEMTRSVLSLFRDAAQIGSVGGFH